MNIFDQFYWAILGQKRPVQKYYGKTPNDSERVIFINIFMLVTHENKHPQNKVVREIFPTFVTLFKISYLFDLQLIKKIG